MSPMQGIGRRYDLLTGDLEAEERVGNLAKCHN